MPVGPDLAGFSITAATTSGPAQAPRPASSIPATGDKPGPDQHALVPGQPAARRGV